MKFSTIYADDQSETHFGVSDLPEQELAMGPPPNPPEQMGAVLQRPHGPGPCHPGNYRSPPGLRQSAQCLMSLGIGYGSFRVKNLNR